MIYELESLWKFDEYAAVLHILDNNLINDPTKNIIVNNEKNK